MQAEFLFGEDNYFDITHSFQVGAATYHVLGLRRDRPTYSNEYYLFNCHQNSPIRSFLPAIQPPSGKIGKTSGSFDVERKALIKAIEGLKKDGESDRARWGKSFEQIQTSIEVLRKHFTGYQSTNNETITTHLQSFFKTVKELETTLLVELKPNQSDQHQQEHQDLRLKTIEENQKIMIDKLNRIAKKIDEQPANEQTVIERNTTIITNCIEKQQTNVNVQLNQIATRVEQQSSNPQISVLEITNSISSVIKAEQTNINVELNHISTKIEQQYSNHQTFLEKNTALITNFIKTEQSNLAAQLNQIATRIEQQQSNQQIFVQQITNSISTLIKAEQTNLAVQLNQISKQIAEHVSMQQTFVQQIITSVASFIKTEQTNVNVQLLNQVSAKIGEYSSKQQISVQQMTNAITNLSVQLNQIEQNQIDLFGRVNIPPTPPPGEHPLPPPSPSSLSIAQVRQLFGEQRSFFQDFLFKQQVNLVEQLNQTINVNLKQISITNSSTSNVLIQQLFIDLKECIMTLLPFGPQTAVPSTNRIPFQVSIETAEYAKVYAKLFVDDQEYPNDQHTLCQRDPLRKNLVQCFVSPPLTSGTLALKIFAKTEDEDQYRAAITVEMPALNIKGGWTFPKLEQAFDEHRCILIEPFRRFVQLNEQLTIHLVLPQVSIVRIHNGEQIIQLNKEQLLQGVLKMKLQVRGHITVQGEWNGHRETNICRFSLAE